MRASARNKEITMALKMAVLSLAAIAAVFLFLPVDDASACGRCGCAGAQAKAGGKNLADTAVAAGQFNTLVAAVKAAGLVETLSGPGPFTVFAPSDAAFARLPAGTIEGLLRDKAALTAILTYHVVPGKLTAKQVVASKWLQTVEGQSIHVQNSGDAVTVDGASISATDIETSNGIIHVIDAVILPRKDIVDTAVSAKTFNTLLAAAKAAGLVDTLKSKGPFTVFAPTDQAFARLPAGTVEALLEDKARLTAILTYHVVPGRLLSTDLAQGVTDAKTAQGSTVRVKRAADGKVTVNDANVVSADIIAGNGVIHVIDAVILPR
jgi:transforming growth factor-beta-induced protein